MSMYNDFQQRKKQRRKKARDEYADVEAELRELASQIVDLCRRHGGAAAMVRCYTTGGYTNKSQEQRLEISANFFKRSNGASNCRVEGHGLVPEVQVKEAVQ